MSPQADEGAQLRLEDFRSARLGRRLLGNVAAVGSTMNDPTSKPGPTLRPDDRCTEPYDQGIVCKMSR